MAGISVYLLLYLSIFLVSGCNTRESPAPVGELGISSKENQGVHVVKTGDTLFSIAWRYGVDFKQVAAWNGINQPYRIYPGQKLKVAGKKTRAAPASPAPVSVAKTKQKSSAKPVVAGKQKATTKPPKSSSSQSPKTDVIHGRGAVKWNWPTSGPILRTFSTRVTGRKGLDIGGKRGQKIKAAAAGKVVYSGSGLVGYGKLIIVKHNDKYLSAYGHNDVLLVKEGQIVRAGSTIAKMGLVAKRPQLHFEIRKDGRPVNPQKYLPRR